MLKKISISEFNKYSKWAYRLALDKSKSSYPTYADGYNTESDFLNIAKSSLNKENEGILLYCDKGEVCGWINYYYLPSDEYISFYTFLTARNTQDALREFEAFCSEHFSGTLHMGFPQENIQAISYLATNDYTLLEHSYPYVFDFNDGTPIDCDSAHITEINKNNFNIFSKLHKSVEDDMYWNSERILDNIESWQILFYDNGKKSAALYMMFNNTAEIFGIDYSNNEYDETAFRALVANALQICMAHNKKHLWYFDEDDNPILTDLRFKRLSEYYCYNKKL